MRLKIFRFKNVNSTNDTAINIIKKTNYKYGVIISDKQKKGKGQYGKKWISYAGNLFISFFFDISKLKLTLKQMTKLNCLLVKKLITKYCKYRIYIKSPNDLIVKKNKISGILQETILKNNNKFMIVGIGINLVKSPKVNDYPTTNLLLINRKKIDKKKIVLDLIKIYEDFIPKLNKLNTKILDII